MDRRGERLLVAWCDVERRLIDAGRRRPREAAVCGARKGDAVVAEVTEAAILPDCVETAARPIHGEIRKGIPASDRSSGLGIPHSDRAERVDDDGRGPGGALVR